MTVQLLRGLGGLGSAKSGYSVHIGACTIDDESGPKTPDQIEAQIEDEGIDNFIAFMLESLLTGELKRRSPCGSLETNKQT
jgi:hypothetical protein